MNPDRIAAGARVTTGAHAVPTARRSRSAGFWLMTAASLLVVVYVAWGYGMRPLGSFVTPTMKLVFQEHRLGIYAHVFAAMFAMAIGPFQLWPALRARWPVVHRWMGRAYLIGVLVGGIAGLYMAMFSVGGIGAQTGFGGLALVWLWTGWKAYAAIRGGHLAEHRRWMIRNFALTFAGVTLRVWLIAGFLSGIPFEVFYPAISWLCWVPNLLIVERWLRRRPGVRPAPA